MWGAGLIDGGQAGPDRGTEGGVEEAGQGPATCTKELAWLATGPNQQHPISAPPFFILN